MFWGLTPSLDLLEEYETINKLPNVLNILIVGGADCRHVLKTISRKYRHKKVSLNFFLIEACAEVIAKQLLLLNVALQPSQNLALAQKTRIFMELYGNTLVRPATAKYLTVTAMELVKMVTNMDYMKEIMPILNLDLKYKERDYLENLFKFWCSNDDFDVCNSWDRRLRKFLGVRYDTKMGAFDWDLHMRLHPIGGKQVCNQEYKTWRSTGVAFTWLESEVTKPNRSMVCGVLTNGEKFAHYGYLGDMQTGPFITYGIKCEDEAFLHQINGRNKYRATDVTERNLRQIFYELETSEEYKHENTSDLLLGNIVREMAQVKVVDVGAAGNLLKRKPSKCFHVENVQIHFISIAAMNMMKYKEQYKNFFHLIYFSSTYLKHMEKDLMDNVATPKSLLLIENQKFVLSYREKELKEFGYSVLEAVKNLDAKFISFECLKDDYAKYLLKENVCI